MSGNTFDLPHYISEIPQFDLSAALMVALAKSADFAITKATNDLYKGVREEIFENNCSLDSLAELNSALNEQVFAETCFYEAGSNNKGSVEAIQALWPLREEWMQQAKELTGLTTDWEGTPRTFEIPDFEEMITNPVVNTSKKTINRITRQNGRKAADLGIDAEDAKSTLEKRLVRESQRNTEMAETMKNRSAGVLHMFHAALQADLSGNDVTETKGDRSSTDGNCQRRAHIAGKPDFHLLPYALRFKLINDTIRTCELQAEWACSNNRLSDDEFDTFDMLCSKTIKALRGIVNSPAFKTAMAAAQATEHMTG